MWQVPIRSGISCIGKEAFGSEKEVTGRRIGRPYLFETNNGLVRACGNSRNSLHITFPCPTLSIGKIR